VKYYYLLSSFPRDVFGEPPPLSSDSLREQCEGALTTEDFRELSLLMAGRSPDGRSEFNRRWADAEIQIGNECARRRAGFWGESGQLDLQEDSGIDLQILETVQEAFEKPTPLERERVLDSLRWGLSSDFSHLDPFGLSSVLACAIHVGISEKWAALNRNAGVGKFNSFVSENLGQRTYLTEFEVYGK